MKTISQSAAVALVLCVWTAAAAIAQPTAPAELDRYNVVWTTPSKDAAGSMPIGNGEVGLNVWVEEDGDLLFYIARTDAWSECNRLLKLGRIRVEPLAQSVRQGPAVPAGVEASRRPDRRSRRAMRRCGCLSMPMRR